MSNYSDDKNPHYYDWLNGELRPTPTAVRDYLIFKQGFWAGEKDKADAMAFTEEEKEVFYHLYDLANLYGLEENEIKAFESFEKKVLGEK